MPNLLVLLSDDPNPKEIRALAAGPITSVVEMRSGRVREALDEVRRIAAAGNVDTLVLRSILLPGVGPRRLVETLGHLHRCEVAVRSFDEPWLSLGGGVGQFATQLAALMTQERNADILSGVARARSQHRFPGRPRAVIPPLVSELADRGLSLRAIARESRLGASTIQRALAPNHQVAISREGSNDLDLRVRTPRLGTPKGRTLTAG
jgi:DNA invertase Pin-like site-specific DNA recombinase